MTTPAFNNSLSTGGTSTALTNEPCSKITANTVYAITDVTKQALDPAVAVVVEVDADGAGGGGYAVAAEGTYVLDRLFGRVTFLADQGSAAIVRIASGSYIPLLTVAEVADVKITAQRAMLDSSAFGTAAKLRTAGLKDCSGNFRLHALPEYDHDPGGGSKKFSDLFDNATPVFLQKAEPGGKRFRAWVLLEQLEVEGNVDALLDTLINWQCAARAGAGTGATDSAAFSWEA